MKNCYYTYRDGTTNDLTTITYRSEYDDVNKMFTTISQVICFSDCVDIDVVEIDVKGRKVRYKGWQPGMKYEFIYIDDNTTAWCGYFPEWDH